MDDRLSRATATEGEDRAGRGISRSRLALLFLKIGCIGFGGGMATIALMEQEVVRRRRLLDPEEFVHGVGLGQVLGPFAVNASCFVGFRLSGLVGSLLCAGAFLTPSVLLVIGLSWLYFTYHNIPALQGAMAGIGPVVIALILGAAWSLGRKTLRAWPAWVVAALALAASMLRANPVYTLAGAGAIGLILGKARLHGSHGPEKRQETDPRRDGPKGQPGIALLTIAGPLGGSGGASLSGMAATLFKVGCVFFGGGFVLVPILHTQVVDTLHWLTPQEFVDGVAISNLTPGPIAVLATFTGFHLHGTMGALVATLALFAPALLLMLVLSWQYDRLKGTHRAQDFLSGVTPAVVGLVLGAALLLAPGGIPSVKALLFAGLTLVLLTRFAWPPAFVLALGALSGLVHWIP
ncbi:MAG TPA: chromate efflux transporter [Candidatus Methylomirabilis sp.]|nr:chromate efflux transporter [Candidatus Methylomirabilis sp.]